MSQKLELGTLVTSSLGLGPVPPLQFDAIAAAAGEVTIDDKTVADKAVQDAKETPSIWFVNFPTKDASTSDKLATYMQDVVDYRCWASGIWWKTVFANASVPQDGSKSATDKRSAYAAKVAIHHMKTTPWLAMSVDHNVSKNISCKSREFHTELITNVLQGFVGITPNIFAALEGILQSLSKTVDQSSSNSDTKTIVCEKYEYIPEANTIASYVRVVSFTVSDSMRNVENAKKTETIVTCDIEYNEYEARFNTKLWEDVAADINESQKKASKTFVDNQTVDCPP